MPKRLPLPLLTAPLLAWSASSAVALGFGAAPGTAVLGAPLDFRVPIRLEPTESLDTACVAATVTSGQSLVPPETVDIALEGQGTQRTLRVATRLVITEPLVTVTLSAGCSSRITRRFTLFADPPGHRIIPLPQPPSVEALAQAAAARAPVVQPAAAVSAGGAAGASAGSASRGAAPPADASATATVAAASSAAGGAPGAPSGATSAAAIPTARPDVAQDKAPSPVPAAGGGASALVATSDENLRRPPSRVTSKIRVRASATAAPALKLEAPQISPSVVAAAALAEREAAAKQAEEIAAAAKAAAAAAEAKAAALERSVAALQQQLKAQRESIEQLTLSLRNTSSYGLPWPWMAAVALLALLSLWLGIRLRRARRDAEGWWTAEESSAAEAATDAVAGLADASSAAPSSVDAHAPGAAAQPAVVRSGEPATSGAVPSSWPSVGSTALASTPAAASASKPEAAPLPSLAFALDDDRSATPAAPAAAPEMAPLPALEVASEDDQDVPVSERTQLMPSGTGMSAPLRAVSIEELLDLEQQVEFFTVLGQDDAAIGLLVDHLRHTGGTYPLPYLKLMEFYRRKGDEDAYGRIRDRFNGRFNAVAPAWGAAKGTGRSLDDYPEVLRQITPVWSRPVDAMALLENMLFRTQAGAMFDLAALSDVLFLFTLARDLHEHDGGGGSDVDVLLPLDGEPEPAPVVGSRSGLVAAVPPAAGPVSVPAELSAGFIASRPMPLNAAGEPSEALDFDLTTSGDPDDGSVASVDLELDAFAAAPRAGAHALDGSAGGIDIPLDAPLGPSAPYMGESVPERVDSGYFDLPPLAEQGRGGQQGGLAPLPAPGGDTRRSDPPMDFDIPLDDAPSPAWGQSKAGRTESTPSLGPSEPMDFNLDLMELAPMERREADKVSSISALDIDLPITPAPPPTTGQR